MKRHIEFIVVHCTATAPEVTTKAIRAYWKEQLGWRNPGYHYLIHRDGEVEKLQNEALIANGVAGYNAHAIHLSYIGGVDRQGTPIDNRTRPQQDAMFDLIVSLSERYPKARVLGHRDFPGVTKACPSFDVSDWLSSYTPEFDQAA